MAHTPPLRGTSASGTAQAWAALGGDPALLDRVRYEGTGGLPAELPVMELARSCVAVCSLAAAELAARRTGGGPPPTVRVDDGAVTAAFHSDRLVRVDGRPWTTFAPLSRFWRASDGWVRTHANYPHHRARLLAALGLPGDAGVEAVAEAIGGRGAAEVEETVYGAGGLAVAARGPKEWAAHAQGALAAAAPLLTMAQVAPVADRAGAQAPRTLPELTGDVLLPAAGVRVLDLSRVLAGPVATRTLALLGADVLRVDAPHLPESQEAHNDTGMGKRSTRLDLGDPGDRRLFDELLADADVVVMGYRPGALDPFGLTPEALAARRPGLVVAQLSAWGRYGPWRERRGFDSLVQVATGIAAIEGGEGGDDTEGDEGRPGVLPAQALDHGTGYLLAAGVLRALTEQHEEGGARLVRLALAQTASWLVHGLAPGPQKEAVAYDPGPWLTETDSPMGRLCHALPPVSFAGGPVNWSRPPGLWGTDAPTW